VFKNPGIVDKAWS